MPFDLIGCGGLLFAQRPSRPLPSDDALATPGQRLAGRGDGVGFRWVELHYEVGDSEEWVQRHYLLPGNWAVTMQEPRRTAGAVADVAQRLAEQMAAQLPR